MNHSRLLRVVDNFAKWAKLTTNHIIHSKFTIYKPKLQLNNLAKIETEKVLMGNNTLSVSKNNHFLKSKVDELVLWYEQLSGMNEVRIAQKRVIEAQDRLILAQDQRREASKQLSAINNKLKEVYSDLDSTTRGEERYLQLITKEHKLLREEKRLVEEFNLSEQEERNAFTLLSSAVKDSHEKERAQAERTKYWSLIGSIIGTVIGVIGSSINNEFKMRELRKMVKEAATTRSVSSELSSETSLLLNKLEKQLSTIADDMNSSTPKNDKAGQLSRTLNNPVETATSEELEAFLQQQRYETRVVIIAATILGVIFPIVLSLVNR